MMRAAITLIAIVVATVTPLAQGQREGPVWFWFSTCSGPSMTLEVRFDDRVIQKSTFPMCRVNRGAVQGQGQAGRIEFEFRPGRNIDWNGYRDSTDRSASTDLLEGNIWQAGADPDALILGVSFAVHDRILMNTLHIAHPSVRDDSTIAKGLVVRTYPAKK